ncbi:MAG: peptidoglycan recognition protein family protein [Solirubrobacterales bacterium]
MACSGQKMRWKLLAVIALVIAVFAAWVAAPALSLRPYTPGGVDFERSVPGSKRLARHAVKRLARASERGERPARWISAPVEAPHEFDLVGIAQEMRQLEIRVRDDGGSWSGWVEQADGTPIYAGGADQVQVRAPFRPDGTLHFVNVSGTAGGTASRLLHAARGAINTAFVSLATATVAEAGAPVPPITPRAGWGADTPGTGCPPRGRPDYGSVGAAVVHHTVSANDYTPEEAPGIVLGICRFHVYGNGWDDIGYNALVDRYGTLYEGRAGGLQSPVVGAHAQGFNDETTSIASVGDHTSEAPTPAAVDSIIQYLAWKLKVSKATPATGTISLTSGGGSQNKYPSGSVITAPRISGHLDLGLTACPGGLYSYLPSIRTAVQKRIGGRVACRKPCRRCKRKGKASKACQKCKKCKRKQRAKRRKLRAKRRELRARRSTGPVAREEARRGRP